jgi:hypothetical protein
MGFYTKTIYPDETNLCNGVSAYYADMYSMLACHFFNLNDSKPSLSKRMPEQP